MERYTLPKVDKHPEGEWVKFEDVEAYVAKKVVEAVEFNRTLRVTVKIWCPCCNKFTMAYKSNVQDYKFCGWCGKPLKYEDAENDIANLQNQLIKTNNSLIDLQRVFSKHIGLHNKAAQGS